MILNSALAKEYCKNKMDFSSWVQTLYKLECKIVVDFQWIKDLHCIS